MNSELKTQLDEYRLELEQELKDLKEERKTLVTKVSNGENLTRKENRRNQKLASLISEIEIKK